jgi:hypothetical protein
MHEVNSQQVSRSFRLEALELDNRLVQLDSTLETDFGSINMSLNSPVPFARIRLSRKNNFAVLEQRLLTWLDLPQTQDAWFTELNRVLNPILINRRPTPVDINTATNHLKALLGVLTLAGAESVGEDPNLTLEFYLESYTSVVVPDVDRLVSTFLSRGSERGLNTLLSGRFTEFFGLSIESLSYSGHFRETIRAVMRDDLPVRKTKRGRRLDKEGDGGSWTDPDYEFDFSDTEDLHESVEIPGDFDEILPPGL